MLSGNAPTGPEIRPNTAAVDTLLELRVRAIAQEAEGIFSFDLRDPEGRALPPFTPGAHLDVILPENLARSYSLVSLPEGSRRYNIAVGRDPASRGGSAYLCDRVRPGDRIQVRPPSNTFPLIEDAPLSVFVAGGIGITPVWCMIQRLAEIGRPWELHYAAKSRARAAFLPDIEALAARTDGRVVTAFGADGDARLALPAIVGGVRQPDAHLYCCGPAGMLQAFVSATAHLPPQTVHREAFAADQAPARGGFEVVLASSGRTIYVPADKTILQTLLDQGLSIARACQEGVCGTCETGVLDGVPDHRDAVLSPREKRANTRMMICVSGCHGDRLVLDL